MVASRHLGVLVFQEGSQTGDRRLLSQRATGQGRLVAHLGVIALELLEEDGQPGGVAVATHGMDAAHPQAAVVAHVGLADSPPNPGQATGADGLQGPRPHLHLLAAVAEGPAQGLPPPGGSSGRAGRRTPTEGRSGPEPGPPPPSRPHRHRRLRRRMSGSMRSRWSYSHRPRMASALTSGSPSERPGRKMASKLSSTLSSASSTSRRIT